MKNCTSALSYVTTIKNCGYATSSSYVTTVMNTVNKYVLPSLNVTVKESYPTIKKGSKNLTVKTLQEKLNKLGYQISIDGIFGTKTEIAVKDFQTKNKLVPDGIVGKKTWEKL